MGVLQVGLLWGILNFIFPGFLVLYYISFFSWVFAWNNQHNLPAQLLIKANILLAVDMPLFSSGTVEGFTLYNLKDPDQQ